MVVNKMNDFERVYQLYKNRKFTDILEQFNEDIIDLKILELMGLSALQLSKLDIAYTCFSKRIHFNTAIKDHYHLALTCMYQKKYSEAIYNYQKCKLDGQFGLPSKVNIAHCLIEENKEEGIEILLSLSKTQPDIKEVWLMLLNHYRLNNKVKELKKTCIDSEKHIGKHTEWMKSTAFVLFNEKKYSQLTMEYENKESVEYISNMVAKSFVKLADFEKAIEIYKMLLTKSYTTNNLYNVAAAYSNLTKDNDLILAIKYAQQCLKEDSNFHLALHCISLVYQKLNENEKSLAFINQAIDKDKLNAKYLYTKAEVLNSLGFNNKSIKQLNKILKINKENNLAHRLKGIINLQINKLPKSEKHLKKAIKLDNTDQRAIAYYAVSKLAQNKNEEVKEFLALGTFVKEFYFKPQPAYDNLSLFNLDLEKDIKNHSLLRREPKGLAARNGYLTDNIFADKTKSIKLFKKLLLEKIQEYINSLPVDMKHHMLRHKTNEYKISSWATLVQGDGFIDKHIHEESWISGAYYCKVPKIINSTKKQEGYFEYGCIPHEIKIDITKENNYVKPEEGKLVIFPSYLYHQTIPHTTSEDRISIAFDLTPKSWVK
jgi:uncharacterized protein (TIGR02466 family)